MYRPGEESKTSPEIDKVNKLNVKVNDLIRRVEKLEKEKLEDKNIPVSAEYHFDLLRPSNKRSRQSG